MTRDISFEVIVVDNASSDGSEEYTTSNFADVIWVNSGGNLGFGRANNLGAEHAKGEYLFLLNSDTILKNNAVKIFYDYMQSHKDERIGALGAWLLDDQGGLNSSFGRFPSVGSEIGYLYGKLSDRNLKSVQEVDVDYIIGADLFISKSLFDELRGFDPRFFMYYEETDLQFRMQQIDYVRRLITDPKIVHLEGGSFVSKGLGYNRFVMSQRSYNYYVRKHMRGIYKFLFHIFLCIIRLSVFFSSWSLKERWNAYKLVVTLCK